MDFSKIDINNFDYHLPQDRIAAYPLEYRDMSKLLIYTKGNLQQDAFFKLTDYLSENTTLIFNNSRVLCARLLFKKETGAQIEIFCLEPYEPKDYQQNLQQSGCVFWKCLIGNKKKWKEGSLNSEIQVGEEKTRLEVEYDKKGQDDIILKFSWNGTNISFGEILDAAGKIPIPPYLMREAEDIDLYRYQTIYSKIKGSVAAPTAGLHFTPRIFEAMDIKGIIYKELTLHVGAGTFKPVQSDNIEDHHMHDETFIIEKDQVDFLINSIDNIIAVGTTSTRLLESLYHLGIQCIKNRNITDFVVNQWEPYTTNFNNKPVEALNALLEIMNERGVAKIFARTSIMIIPGYDFKMIKGLITNFHQPKSTLLLLIAALIGDEWKNVYEYALRNEFRFLSYGDGSLLLV